MNTENMKRVLAHIEANTDMFDMSSWCKSKTTVAAGAAFAATTRTLHRITPRTPQGTPDLHSMRECGTTLCIAGWAALLAGPDAARPESPQPLHIKEVAATYLGLDTRQAASLFFDARDEEALDCLRGCIDTGRFTFRQAER